MFRNSRGLVYVICFAILLSLTLPARGQKVSSQGPVQPRITAPIDSQVRTTIAKSTHPLAQAQFDRGPVDPGTAMNRMILVLGGSADQDHQLRTLLDSQQTKGSPDYHQWLTPEEFGQKFGPSPQDIQQVTNWLQQEGFKIDSVAKSGRWIEFSGNAGQVNRTFQTTMRNYQVAGKLHTANSSDITIPSALAPVVLGVASLHDFYSKPMHKMYHPDANVPLFGGPQQHTIAPADFVKIYNLQPLYTANLNGTGETIAIVAASNINTVANNGVDDVATFRSLFGLPASAPNIILNGPDPGVDTQAGIGFEATLDVEWSGAVAPNATIDIVVSGGSLTTDPIALGSSFIVDQNLAPIMNVSFGLCEAQLNSLQNAFWNALWQQAAAQGISVFVASGDGGAAGCDSAGESLTAAVNGVGISGFASTPFNTAVGGTEFDETVPGGVDSVFWTETPNTLASANGFIPEMAWNDSCTPSQANSVCPLLPAAQGQFLLLGTGGGVSTQYPTPPYQTLSVTGLSALNNFTLPGSSLHPRGIPDVSLDAAVQHDPYLPCFTSDLLGLGQDCQLQGGLVTANTFQNPAGGTSFASPEFAGIMAIVDQKLGGRQGLANYVLYSLATKETFSSCNSATRITPGTTTCVFNDTTVGNNGMPGNDVTNDPTTGALGFPTATGYDLSTGLGSVDANNLVTAWGNVTFSGSQTTLSSTSGASINITHGQSVQFTVNVQKAGGGAGPTGNVGVVTSQTAPQGGTFTVGAGTLSSGSFTGSFNDLPGGTYNVTANYPGDGTFAGSTSNAIPATVTAEGTTTALQSFVLNINAGLFSPSTTIAYGDPANLLFIDADTKGNSGLFPASGNVTFTIGGSTITPIAIDNSGIGEYIDCLFPTTTCLTPGSYTVSATYGGDGLSYNGSSTTASITVNVTKGPSKATVTAPSPVATGQQFTLSVLVQSAGFGTVTPTGSVQFFDGGTAIGSSATLSGGTASAPVTLNSSGAHSITASYSGDSTYNASTSAATTVTVTAPFSFTPSGSTSQTIPAGSNATYNFTLGSVGGFTGAVSFTCGGAPGPSTCTVSPNPANLTGTTTSVPITVTVGNTANARLGPSPFHSLPFVFAAMFAGLLWGVRKKPRQALLMVLALGLMIGVGSCGSGGGPNPITKAPTVATLTVTGTSGSNTNSITLSLTITH